MLTPVVDCDQESYTGAQRRRDVVVSHQPPDCSPCEGTSQRSTCKRCTDVFSAAPIPSTACCSFYLQYSVVASGEESQNCINPYAKPPSLKALRRRLRGSHTLHSVAVEVPAAICEGLSFFSKVAHRNCANIRWNVSRSSIFSCKTRKTMLLSIFR